jgi:hypothetical protein
MKIVILCAIMLSAAMASAETIIIEYPDHYYVDSTGTPTAKPAPSAESSSPPVKEPSVANYAGNAPSVAASPVTNFDNTHTPPPVDPAERRAAMDKEIQRLQRERGDLLTPRDGETPDEVVRRQQRAAGILRKINKLSSELVKTLGP